MVFTALGGLIFVVVGAFMLAGRVEPANWFVRAIGGVGVLFFGACVVVVLPRIFSPRPALTLTAEGIEDTSAAVTPGFVFWKDIIGFSYWSHQGQRGLCVHLRDPERYLDNLPVVKRNLLRANIGLVGTPWTIMQGNISIPLETLEQSMEARIAHLVGQTHVVDPLASDVSGE